MELNNEYLRSVLFYDPETGIFVWKKNLRPRAKIGNEAGTKRPDGYISISIRGHIYLAHRLAWFYMTNKWPIEQIDHCNLTRSDNRWKNLREASHAANLHNRGAQKNNKARQKGVYKRTDCNRWQAHIAVNGKNMYLGLFKTKEQAADAYAKYAAKLHGEFSRTV